MNRKTVVILLVVIAVAIAGIAYGTSILNSQTAPSTSTANCKPESMAGNFTSSPRMDDMSSGPYALTFYIQNLAPQSATITQYTDNNGLTQSVNWTVPPTTTGSFQTTIDRVEGSLVLETSCQTVFTANVYYATFVHHYSVMLNVSLGGATT